MSAPAETAAAAAAPASSSPAPATAADVKPAAVTPSIPASAAITEKPAQLDTAGEIIKQVEFYLSDSNLPRDEFLKKIYDDSEGWIPVATIASFKRMRNLTSDLNIIVDALKKSTFLKLNEDASKVTRANPLPAVEDLQLMKNSVVHIRNLPVDATIEDIQAFWSQPKFGGITVKCVRLKRNREDKSSRGIAFLELSSEAEAKRVAETYHDKIRWHESDTNSPFLQILTRDQFFRWKKEEDAKMDTEEGAAGGKKGRKRKAEGDAAKSEEGEEAKEGEDAAAAKPKPEMKPDRIVKLSGLADATTREMIKEYIMNLGGQAGWVDYSVGEPVAMVRLHDDSALAASQVVTTADEKKSLLNNVAPTVVAVVGDEEKAYWDEFFEQLANRNQGGGKRGGKGGRGGRGGRGRGRGRGGKRAKTE